jgi:FkbM family methyltransferase
MNIINRLLTQYGYRIEKYPSGGLKRRLDLLKSFNVDMIFDIGANEGQYVQIMRSLGYDRKVVSFEPLSNSYKHLAKNAESDNKWQVRNYALGKENIVETIYIAGNAGQSSSFLSMTEKHTKARKSSAYVGSEKVEIKRLDSILNEFYMNENLFLKIDTQGYEKQVLEGIGQEFSKITGIQVELSLVDLYNNSVLYLDIINILRNKGFELFSIEPGFTNDKTGQLLQFDGIFFRKGLINE